jgi:hypothetical protein
LPRHPEASRLTGTSSNEVAMCKRTTTDPLIRAFLDRYGLNLLMVPREGAAVGDLYVTQGSRVLPPARIEDFLQPAVALPPARHEVLADLAGLSSRKMSWDAGLGFLEGFLTALGAFPLVESAKTEYRRSGVTRLAFRLAGCRRIFTDLSAAGTLLAGRQPRPNHPLRSPGSRYYMTTAVVQSASLSVRAEQADGRAPRIDVSLLRAAGISASVNVAQTGAAELTYEGKRRLAIGVELIELLFDPTAGLHFAVPKAAMRLRDGAQPPRAFLGSAESDAFFVADDAQ